MNQTEEEFNKSRPTNLSAKGSIKLAFMPAFFAAGCCATAPLMVIFGVSVAEVGLYEYRWYFRVLGFVIFSLSLLWYFRSQGFGIHIHKENFALIWITVLQASLYTVVLYAFFVYVATPLILERVLNYTEPCCSL